MKRLLFVLCLAYAAFAQAPPVCSGTPQICSVGGTVTVQSKPAAVPTGTTNAAVLDAYLQSVTVSNPTGSAITFTMADRQGSPVSVLGAISVAANTTYVIQWTAQPYWCPSGFTILAGGSGLTWQGVWRQ